LNEEKLNEVGELVEVDSQDITKNKIRKKITLVYYYFIQLGFLAISSLVGYLFGLHRNAYNSYPYSGSDQYYLFGSLFIALVHGGNLGLTYGLKRKDMLITKVGSKAKPLPFHIYPAIFLNILLSVFCFVSIYNIMISGYVFTTTTDYGVFTRRNSKRYRKIMK
jgi:hypothetical protein